ERRLRRRRLAALEGERRTVLFYEAPHRLRVTLDELAAAFGGDRSVTLCRELTKLHEEIWKTTLAEAAAHYAQAEPRGEYVLVMAGAPEPGPEEAPPPKEAPANALARMRGQGFPPRPPPKPAAQAPPTGKGGSTN